MSFFRRSEIMVPELTVPVELDGAALDGIPGSADDGRKLFGRDVLDSARLTVRLWADDLSGTPPEAGDRVSVSGRPYRVLETRRRLDFLILDLGDEYER